MANEKRVRANLVAGALSADMAIGATSMSSAGLADLPVVDSTNHAAITLFQVDANGRVTKKEIIHVTAHTAGATTATIVKAQESTTDQGWNGTSAPDKWVHAPTSLDFTGDTLWSTPTLSGTWVNAGTTGFPGARYRKTSDGVVHIEGLVQGGAQFDTIFTLPAGYRPATKLQMLCLGSSVSTRGIEIDPDGSVIWLSSTGLPVDLSMIHFVAEA